MFLLDLIKSALIRDLKMFEQIEKILAEGPKENLIERHIRGKSRYYYAHPGERKQHYISKSNYRYVQQLLQMREFRKLAKILEENIKLLEEISKKYHPIEISLNTVSTAISASIPFPQSENPYNQNKLNFVTSFGLKVRSKSELAIAELLYITGLEFYYEKALHLKNFDGTSKTVFPDFTICLPNGKIIYWELKGMMQDESYIKRDAEKMRLYHYNNIYEPRNLIVTADGPDGQLDLTEIQFLIRAYLIPKGNLAI